MSNKISLEINGKKCAVDAEKSILDACRDNDIFIPTLCEMEEIDLPYGGCRVCLVEVEGSEGKEITTSCDTPVEEGIKVKTETEEVIAERRAALELLLSEHTGDCVPPCTYECPASLDVQGYIAHIANGRPEAAVKLIKEKTPLAVSLGRACFAPCEDQCRRELAEEPMAIRQLKEYAAEKDLEDPWEPEIHGDTGKEVGIVGGGPAGLTAAYFLRLEGHSVTIYDQMSELGGMMRYGIPNYRLPNDLLAREIDWIMDRGVSAEMETKLGEDFTLEELRREKDSVLLATGAWESWIIPIPGHELEGVMGGTDFLVDHSSGKEMEIGDEVAVIGCGGCAMDTARVAKRLGADVTVVYRRTEEQAPAPEAEIEEAKEEGIEFKFLLSPEEITGEERVDGITCAKMELGEPDESGRAKPVKIEGETELISCDTVLMSIGESPEAELLETEGVELEDSTIKNYGKYRTNYEDVFAAGDTSIGPSSIAESTGQGREAAYAVNAYLNGEIDDYEPPEDFRTPFGYVHRDEKTTEDFADEEELPRVEMPRRDPEKRIKNFEPIEHGYSDEEAVAEAKRCLECGCLDRYECELREYSDRYDARQDYYEGERFEREIDDSHPRVERDPNKCILCGSCVRTSEEVHGEGELQFVNRGFSTKVAPPFEQPLGESESELIGDLADSCPTGALEEVLEGEKPGPFEPSKTIETRCLGCGLTCPATVEVNQGRPIRLVPAENGTYGGHLCDKGKFTSLAGWQDRINHIVFRNKNGWKKRGWDTVVRALEERKVDVVLGRATTMEEGKLLRKLARTTGGDITAISPREYRSTLGLEELRGAEALYVEDGVYKISPVFKAILKQALDGGATLTNDPDELPDPGGVGLFAPRSENPTERRIVASPEANGNGLTQLGLSESLGGGEVLLLWDQVACRELEADTYETIIWFGHMGEDLPNGVDGLVPIRSWLEKEGRIVNSLGETIELTPGLDSELRKNAELLRDLIDSLKSRTPATGRGM